MKGDGRESVFRSRRAPFHGSIYARNFPREGNHAQCRHIAQRACRVHAHRRRRVGRRLYVSNAEDGDIGIYTLQPDGSLKVGDRAKAAALVMPMAASPDKKRLYAAIRSRPFSVFGYAIDPATGALTRTAASPLADSYPYIAVDKTGRVLLGAS